MFDYHYYYVHWPPVVMVPGALLLDIYDGQVPSYTPTPRHYYYQ